MKKVCANSWCKASFDISEEDRTMAMTFDIEWNPEHCPTCRHQYRGMFSAFLNLHRRTSSMSGNPMLSIFSAEKPFPVYSIAEWWSDTWDAVSYGRPFDFSKPFFPQFEDLHNVVPKIANFNEESENTDYSTNVGRETKNVYYCLRVYRSQDIYYSEMITGYNNDLVDCLNCQRSGELWECVQCIDCHLSSFLHRCYGTRDSHFCIDCRGCSDCLFCWNLRNKSYYIENKPVTKEQFAKIKAMVIDGRWLTLQKNLKRFAQVHQQAIWPALMNVNCEECRGDQLYNCSRAFECYNCVNCQDNRYCWELSPSEKSLTSMDMTRGGIGELQFNSASGGGGNYMMRMCVKCRHTSDMTYCIDCFTCKDCFGCTGLRSKRFCILNQQCSKEEYEALVPKIIAHMKKMKEWGTFFPHTTSPFAYNESASMCTDPLKKEEVLARGWQWADLPDLHQDENGTKESLPDSIADVTDDICKKVLLCESTGRKCKILPQELKYYRTWNLPLPRHHADVRMQRRRAMINPYQLWRRPCGKCTAEMETSFSPERPETVYCEKCYLEAVY